MSDLAQNFKVIVALKSQKDLKTGTIRCAIQINDKVKFTVLPQSEGQFFDINDLSVGQPITIMFDVQSTGHRIGDLKINVPSTIYQEKEVELADSFQIDYKNENGEPDRFNGRYYIIILNKGEVRIERDPEPETVEELAHEQMQQSHVARAQDSPTKQFIKSTGERTQERTKKDQSKKLLAETKYDPKPVGRKQSGRVNQSSVTKYTASQAASASTAKKQQQKQLSKYNSQRSFDQKKDNLTPNRPKTEAITEGSNERMRTPPQQQRQQSPFSRYRGSQIEKLSPQELEAELAYWKGVSQEQENQLSQAEGNGLINDHLGQELHVSEQKRKELQGIVRDSVDEGVKFREELDRKVTELVLENQKLTKKVKQQAERINELDKGLEEKALVIKEKDNTIHDLDKKLKGQEELKRICAVQQDKLEEQDLRFKDLQKNYQDQIKNLVASINRLEATYTKLLAEKAISDANNQDLLGQIQRQAEKNFDLEAQIAVLKSECELKASWELSAITLKQQNNELHIQLLDARNRGEQLQQVIEQLRKDLQNLENQSDHNQKAYLDKLQALKEVIKGQDQRYSESEAERKTLQKQVLLLKEQIASLQLGAQLSQEILKQLEAFKKHNQALMADTASMAATIEELTDSLQATNNKILELRADVLHQQQLTQEAEQHNNNLKRLILEMRERGIAYIPIKEDAVDQKLAAFINNRQDADRQRQLFVREGEGVYQFGSKKIYIKVEQDKILIRSGGGYISIEEFLNLYSQREMEGMMRGDPLAALQRNQAALRKRDDMKLVNNIKDEQMSPLKKRSTQFD